MFKRSFLLGFIAAFVLVLLAGAGGMPGVQAALNVALQDRVSQAALKTCQPNALVLLDITSIEAMDEATRALEKLGGCALHSFPPNALVGFVPVNAREQVLALKGVTAVYDGEVDVSAFGGTAQAAAYLWNTQYVHPQPPSMPGPGARPLMFDQKKVMRLVDQPDPNVQTPHVPGYYDVSSFMAGRVAVGIILPESNGTIDPQTENWSDARKDQVVNEIVAAMNWWGSQNPSGAMSFVYTLNYPVATGYEPITRPSTDDGLWIHQTLGVLGYSDSTWSGRAYHYLNDLRTNTSADWAVVIYVVDSQNDADGMFTDGYFGYSYGFLIVMTYDNDGWGIANMDSVTAHEFGHNFGAADEYCQVTYSCCWGGGQYGYLGIANGNCEAGCDNWNAQGTPTPNGICDGNDQTPGSGCQGCSTCRNVNCLYRNGTVSAGLDTPSKEQVGIRDSDGDSRLDPVDTTPNLNLLSFLPDPTNNNNPTWNGGVTDVPYDSPTMNDVSINDIVKVEYRLDGDLTWRNCSSMDGIFDNTTESYFCQSLTGPLPDGLHTIFVRALNLFGNYSTVANDTVFVDTIPPTPPTSVNPGCAATNNAWQNTCADANFTWSGASDGAGSGIAGYYYYWGPDPVGTATNLTPAAAYDPPAVTNPSVNYLNVQTVDNAGNVGPWTTLFILKYDGQAPANPTSIDPGCTATNDVWQNTCADANFTWSGAGDGVGSGVASYRYYWGSDPNGTSDDSTVAPAYDPPAVSNPSITYLRVQTKDVAGNLSAWITLFTLKYDAQAPNNPTLIDPGCTATNNTWQNTCADVNFTWSGASDGAGTGIASYRYYWGSDPGGTASDTTASPGYDPPTANDPSVNYLRVQTLDSVGNMSSWMTLFTLKYDGQAPTNPTSVDSGCAAVDNTWQNTCADANFTWGGASDGTGSGVASYSYYWGSDPNGTASSSMLSPGYDPPAVTDPSTTYLRVQTQDMAGNLSAWAMLFTLKYDATVPDSSITSIETVTSGQVYRIHWDGTDAGSGLQSYDVQYRVGTGGAWMDWLTNTLTTTAEFGPTFPVALAAGETYYFQVRAGDQAGNLETYPGGDGDRSFTVEVQENIYLPLVRKILSAVFQDSDVAYVFFGQAPVVLFNYHLSK